MLSAGLFALVVAAVDVGDRDVVALYVVAPPGSALVVRPSEVLDVGDRLIRKNSDLRLFPVEQIGVDSAALAQCPHERRFACWVSTILRAARAGEKPLRRIMVVAPLATETGDATIFSMMIDPDSAIALERTLDASATEGAIYESAFARTDALPAGTGQRVALRRILDRLIRDSLRSTQHWRPLGAVEVFAPAGTLLSIDGRTVTTSTAAQTRLVGVRAGTRKIRGQRRGETNAALVQVRRGLVARTQLVFKPPVSERAVGSLLTLWGGAIVGAAGATTLIYALAAQPSRTYAAICPASGCPPRGQTGFSRPCQLAANDPSCVEDPGALLIAPLGLAMLGAGASAVVGSLLIESETETPWWTLAVSVVGGAVIYGAAALLGSGQPLGRTIP